VPDAGCDISEVANTEPTSWEPGNVTFTRNLARHLSDLLRLPIGPMRSRTNPYGRRPCAKVDTFEVTVGAHDIVVTAYETTHLLIRGPIPAYAVVIDGERIPFERPSTFERLEWQLARSIWIAVTDRQFAADRAAAQPVPGGPA
jgi:hypothetical protein